MIFRLAAYENQIMMQADASVRFFDCGFRAGSPQLKLNVSTFHGFPQHQKKTALSWTELSINCLTYKLWRVLPRNFH